YAQLRFAEDTADPRRGAFMQQIQTRLTQIQNRVIFFQVAWTKLDEAIAVRWLSNPSIESERHFLENARKFAPYTLSEAEEKILSLKSNTSNLAFCRLFDETLNQIPFTIRLAGKTHKKTEAQILSLQHDSRRTVRKSAAQSLGAGLIGQTRLLTYVYNMILADHRLSMQLRNWRHPMEPMNLYNEIDLESVESLIRSVQEAYPLVSRYYRLKKKLLRLDQFCDYDRHAPIGADTACVPWKEACGIVLESLRQFSPEALACAKPFFERGWIDAEIRPGKQGGGFCCATTPELHPYILINYTGSMRDVLTLAHEIGHGIHQSLSAQAGILQMHAPLTLAETASVFGEMLAFDRLLAVCKSPRQKLALLCDKIDDNFATVFRQVAITDFELACHRASAAQGELAADQISNFWVEANRRMYQKSVVLTKTFPHGWKYISHIIHSPFYCYAYSFAQLVVLTLYQKYRQDPAGFVPGYFKMLSLGGSDKPDRIAAAAGLDLKAPDFWKSGLKLLEGYVLEAERLASSV
ncbi:MAG: M3 family oligoendopeptidase, partial [Candidatus Omnitrophota bacterium]